MNLSGTLTVTEANSIRWDAIVIGAGVAGSIAARQIARSERRVLLIDKRRFPRRKVCGACLNQGAIDLLSELGLFDCVQTLNPTRLSRFVLKSGSQSITLPLPGGIAVSREVLDATLVQAAIASGCDFLPDMTARIGHEQPDCREVRVLHGTSETHLTAQTVVVAAGLEGLGLTDSKEWVTQVSHSSRLGTGCVVEDNSDSYGSGAIWMTTGQGGYVGLVRVEDGRLNVAAALDREYLRRHGSPTAAIRNLLHSTHSPVPEYLETADWLGTVPLTRQTNPVASGRVFLVGDAAGYVEPFTGEGMTWALMTGAGVASWVERTLSEGRWSTEVERGWRGNYRTLVESRQRFCKISTGVLRSRILVSIGMSALTMCPWLAKHFIARMNASGAHGRLAHSCRS